ncbi:hypothetical protein [Thauera aromatica]|uniref:hypothetical protein n=1 Tax=Thauera aromatica TaxID=59405 RepID=UPI001FFDA2A8|nr:hypothetical protein [Thauera aromatica]MCK2095237.1 hypothetical protein [Thauera aromatica]
MPIQEQNIVFVESQVMDDVPEGGGAATGRAIVDGAMNNVFEDISDLDRAYGRFNLRKLFLAVRTLSTDLYGGAKTVVTALPADEALGYTLFSSNDPFDTRSQAADKVESYLYKGPTWPGYLYENHITGMRAINLIQRVGTALPPIGKTLCIVQDEGLSTEKEQYVRVTGVDAVEQTFSDSATGNTVEFQRWVVTLGLSDALRFDFAGHSPRYHDSNYSYSGRARLRDTTVADAARYYGAQPLSAIASVGDRVVRAASMFTKLVPSARTESPLANQMLGGRDIMVPTATTPITHTVAGANLSFAANGRLALPTGVLPGSLAGPQSTTDDGAGTVLRSGVAVGTIVYATGDITFNAAPGYSVGSTADVTWLPAVALGTAANTLFRQVTAENRRFNWVETLQPTPAPGALSVSYMANGNWYVLTDDGTGLLVGADSALGAGQLSYVTGVASVTLGALPDAGSLILFSWANRAALAIRDTSAITPITWSGVIGDALDEHAIAPGSLTITWQAGGVTQTLTDDGAHLLGGNGYGAVKYTSREFWFRPAVLPDPGTTPVVTYERATLVTETFTPTADGNGFVNFTLAQTPIVPRSLSIEWETIRSETATEKATQTLGSVAYYASSSTYSGSTSLSDTEAWKRPTYENGKLREQEATTSAQLSTQQIDSIKEDAATRSFAESESSVSVGNIVVKKRCTDDGAGALYGPQAGLVDYATGQVYFIPTDIVRASSFGIVSSGTVSQSLETEGGSSTSSTSAGSNTKIYLNYLGEDAAAGATASSSTSSTALRGSSGGESTAEEGTWGAEAFTDTWGDGALIRVQYVVTSTVPTSESVTLPAQALAIDIAPTSGDPVIAGSLAFRLGGSLFVARGSRIVMDPDRLGSGLEAGTLDLAAGRVTLDYWPAGGSGAVQVLACLTQYGIEPAIGASFRTAVAPVAPESLNLTATTLDGETISATADADGKITASWIYGAINYEFGTVQLAFGQYGPDPEHDPQSPDPAPTVWIARPVDPSSIRYNAVAYNYLPLDAGILGIDPVRLPADGRVPIYRAGDVVMIMHATTTAPATVANGGTVDCGRTRIAWIRVIDATGATVRDGFTLDRATGLVTFTDVSGMTMPVTVRHTVGDLRQITDAQISGQLTLARALTHDYPAGESLVASCLIHGDRRARVSAVWDQATWDGTWTDALKGSEATATLDTIAHPIEVTNEGAETERWILRWTSTTNVELIGQRRGLVYSGPFSADIAPINPRTRIWDAVTETWTGGVPYLTIPVAANGGGWSAGNVVRINTVGALADIWIARSIQQSDEPIGDGADGVEIYALGNIDRP